MSGVSRAEIERVARLARLDVEPAALPTLTDQIGRILEYISQLDAVDPEASDLTPPWLDEQTIQPLRPDEVHPQSLRDALADIAPAFRDGFVVVPRLEAMDDE